MISASRRAAAPRVRLFSPAEQPALSEPSIDRQWDEATIDLVARLGLDLTQLPPSLSPGVTLPEFFVLWFWPNVMRGKRDSAQATVNKMIDALRWWRRLTSEPPLGWSDDLQLANDPPLSWIDDDVLTRYQEGLRRAVWRRGRLGSWQTLAAHTITGHLSRCQELLDRAGPTYDRRRPGKGLIETPLAFEYDRPRCTPDPTFSLDEARRIVTAAVDLVREERPRGRAAVYPPPSDWRTFFGIKFVSGVRVQTMFRLRWEWLVEELPGAWQLKLPPGVMSKTGKEDRFTLPEWLAAHLARYRRTSGLLFPFRMHPSTLDKIHRRLQQGIVAGEPLGFNAWRRLMTGQLAELGAQLARDAARGGLNHSSSRTTTDSYCDVDNLLRPRLPPLWEGPIGLRQSLLF